MKIPHPRSLFGLLASCILPLTVQAASPRYSATDIGVLDASHPMTQTVAINNAGQVLVWASDGNTHTPALYENGQLRAVAGVDASALFFGLNDAGVLVGRMNGRAITYDHGAISYIGALGEFTQGVAINESGTVAGELYLDQGPRRLFVYENDAMRYLGPTQQYTLIGAINERGEIAASVDMDDGRHAILYRNGEVTDLGYLGVPFAMASDINDRGTVIGVSADEGVIHAVIYENGVLRNLGLPTTSGSNAVAINNAGQVIGGTNDPGIYFGDPYVWQDGKMEYVLDLVDPSFKWREYMRLVDINDAGQIIGEGCWQRECHAFVLTPVPEPAIAWMLASSLGWMAVDARRRHRRAAGSGASRRRP